jgi:hypothetical protein
MKPVTYTFNPWNSANFDRESGHLRVWASVFSNSENFTRVSFIFDTGAYITVLSQKLARQIGLPLKGNYTANLTGFNKERGSDMAEIVIAPKIEIGRIIIESVKILVPLDDIAVPEVIGENILEYFNYAVDHDIDNIYFAKNPNPKPYINNEKGIDLSCGRVLVQDTVR